MKKSKLVRLLAGFSQKEFNAFKDFVHSPFFNKNEDTRLLFDALAKYHPNFPAAKIDKQKIYKAAFGKDEFSEKKLGYLSSNLVKLVEKYASVSGSMEDTASSKYHYLTFLNRPGFEHFFQGAMNEASKDLLTHRRPSSTLYYHLFKLHELGDKYFFVAQRDTRYKDYAIEAMTALDKYYLIEKIRHSISLLNRKNIISSDYEIAFFDQIIKYLDTNLQSSPDLLQLYYLVYLTLDEPGNQEYFYKLKQQFIALIQSLNHDSQIEIATCLLNYCNKKLNEGKFQYFEEMFSIYELGLNSGFLQENGWLRPTLFKNIVTVALRLKKFEWTEKFIHENAQKIQKKYRDNALNYNRANLHYQKKEYDKALILLQMVDFSDIFYALDTKAMQLRIYYELDEFDAIQALIQSFTVYLKRNKQVSANQKTIYLNLLKYTKKLISLAGTEKEKLQKLSEEINETKQIAYLNWLSSKVEEKLGK